MKTNTETKATRSRLATLAIHAGSEPDNETGAVSPPVYQTSTYAQSAVGVHKGYEYARTQNQTRERLEKNVAALEGAAHGLAYASGMAAVSALMHLFRSGDQIVASNDLYGGTYRLFERVLTSYGLGFTYLDTSDADAVAVAVKPETRALYLETPSNPLMRVTDLARMTEIGRKHDLLTIVDNTFMSPYFQRPLEFGIDVVVHSTTKYLNGHSDLVGGVVATSRDEVAEKLRFVQNAVGAVPGPWDCWLTLRGTKTLALRMERHDQNGRALASWLEKHPKVQKIYYPGLSSHPHHELASRQMSGFGGMISVDLGSLEAAKRFLGALELFTLAESLGGVESLASHPASMTHGSMPRELRESTGLTDGLARLSVGCEDLEDLREDLEQALARA
jgi:cystathionine beta-lyase/cystathionine gamma-synthase